MSNPQRDKGMRFEREFATKTGGTRVPLSGAMGGEYSGDVKALGLLFECKVRKNGFKKIYEWLENVDALAIKADRQEILVVIPLETFMRDNRNMDRMRVIKDLNSRIKELKSRIKDLENVLGKQYDPLSYGDRFRKIRIMRGVTEEEIARAVGVDKSIVIEWENNVSRPTYEELVIAALFLKTSTRYLELGLIESGKSRIDRRGA